MRKNQIEVRFAKSGRIPVLVDYELKPLARKQARLLGRVALHPVLTLKDFHRRAVIDWVDLKFWLSSDTQARWVKRAIDRACGGNCFVRDLPPSSGSERANQNSDLFSVVLQEPTIASMLLVEKALEEKWGLELEGIVRAMEVSVDFTPKEPSPDNRTRLLTVQQPH